MISQNILQKKLNELNISKGSLKFDHPSLQIENRDKDDINPNKLDNLNKEIKSDLETKIKLNKNDINIKNPEIELKNPNGGLKMEKLNENIGIVIPWTTCNKSRSRVVIAD